jgi:hypothetical protein
MRRRWGLDMPKLTKRLIDAAQADAAKGEVFLWDWEVKGFGLRVKPSGVKSFVLKYRVGGQTKRYTVAKSAARTRWTRRVTSLRTC